MCGSGPSKEPAPRAFGGIGQSNEVDLALGAAGVRPSQVQKILTDPMCQESVAAALDGKISVAFNLDNIAVREQAALTEICGWMGTKCPTLVDIKSRLTNARKHWGVLTADFFVLPPDLGLPQLFEGIYGFNQVEEARCGIPLKLFHKMREEWWRADKSAETIPTELGVLQDTTVCMRRPSLDGAPLWRSSADQIKWAEQQGADGITSVEETVYLWLRNRCRSLMSWATGSVRCRNKYGSGDLLHVYWSADGGFYVYDWCGLYPYWSVGALPRKFCGA